MNRWPHAALALLFVASGALAGRAPARADDPAPHEPPPDAAATPARPEPASAESRVLRSLLRSTGRLMLRYLDDKQDPEKAAAYEDIFRATGGVLSHLDRGDEQATVAAGMKALLDLMPTMRTPKRAEVMRDVLMTLATSVAEDARSEGARREGATAGPAADSTAGDDLHALGDVLVGGLADGMLEAVTRRALGGAQLDALAPGRGGFPVKTVEKGSRAAAFGLEPGDVIVRFGEAPATWRTLLLAVHAFHVNGTFSPMAVRRDGKRVELKSRTETPPPGEAPTEADPK